MRLYAPAKINWSLEVLGRRDDGYHEVHSVLQTIDLSDVIEVTPAPELRLDVEGQHEASEDDLLLRAARLLHEESGYKEGALIRLSKEIPVAAGLGGGSSDAAALLRGLNQLWGLGWGRERLASLAAMVSSDAPFFLWGGTALAQGRGERITPLPDVAALPLLLVMPPWSLPAKTARMYASLDPGDFSDGSRTQRLVEALHNGKRPRDDLLYNAFERVAYKVWPQLAQYRDALLEAGARRVHLAGSGPALFVLADNEQRQRLLKTKLGSLPGQIILARTLGAAAATRLEP